jgi:hypothetical protein
MGQVDDQSQQQSAPAPTQPSPGDIAFLVTLLGVILAIVFFKFWNPLFPIYFGVAELIVNLVLVPWQIAGKQPSLFLSWFKNGGMVMPIIKKPYDLFISYRYADVIWAEWIAETLQNKGYRVIK